MKRILTLLALILGFVFQGQSQLLTANQCESSPCNARAICGNTVSTTYSYITTPASNPIGTCASSTGTFAYSSNWVYYRFTCYSTGTFQMKLNSNDSTTIATDLDWAMWDITLNGCSSLTTTNIVECNAAGAGSTGIFTGGTPSANYENNVTITAGSTYIIGISNPTGTNTGGFTMNFGGTASITDNKKPYMASILPFDPCSPVTSIKIKLSEPVRCDQLNAGVDYTLSPAAPTYTAAAAGCSGCSNVAPNTNPNFYGNATDTVVLTFATALTPGTYTITPVANAWRDLCLNADSTTATLTFIVPAPFKDTVRSGFDCLTLKYIDTVYGVNGLSPYQYKAVGGGLAASFGTYGPVGGTPGYTIYTVSGGTPVIYSVKDNGGCEVDTTLNRPSVLAMSSPNLSASANPPCHDQFALDSITSINQTGGTGPYTFSLAPTYPWTFVAPNKWKNINFSPALGVTFTVTVTDAHGCTKTGVKNLVNPTVVNLLLATPTNPQCNGDSTGKICFGQATGGTPLYTYTINPSYTNTTFTTSPSNCFNNLPAGTYTVTALDANSCSATGTKTLSQPAVITINTSAATIVNPTCPANCNGTYQPVGNGGTGPKKFYKYPYIGPGLWDYSDSVVSSVAPNNKFDSLCAGTYTVIAKDAFGCTATATFTLALPISPVMNIGTITPVACFGGVGTIAVNITSATPTYTAANYTYQVAPVAGMGVTVSGAGGINGLYTGVPVGTYDLIITNANACADTVFGVTMTQPPSPVSYASVVVDSVLCFGSATGNITAQATGGTAGANSYQYSIKIGAAPFTPYSAPQLTPYTFTNLAAGTYTIRVRDHNLCTKDSIVTIYQPTKLNLLLDEVEATCFGTSDGEICVVDTGGVNDFRYKLGIAGAYSAFQPAGLVYCFSNLAAGNYSVYTIDIKGCLDTLAVTVAAIPLPVVSYTASPNDTVCDGTSITLSGTGANTYTWSGGITDGNPFTPTLGTTQYIVTGTNTTTGCENMDTAFVLVNPIPVMNPINNQIVCNNTATLAVFPGSSVATASYAWSHDATAAIGIGTNGTGSIPSFIAINTGITPIVVTFTVTPTGPAITNCVGADITFTITINPDAHIALDPASGSNTQTVCIGEAINDIIYNVTGGGTGASVTGLPTGVTGSFLGGVFTMTGTPTGPAGIYTYTVTTSGSCAQATATGTITVSPDAIITQTSPIGTQAQLLCINTNLATISYSITGTGTNAIVTGLPVGVFQNYAAGTLTITGSPAIAGFYTYTVTATGTCGSTTTTGTIDVTPLQDPSFTYSSPTFCTTGINPLPSITGSTGGTFSATPAGLSINPITGLINLSASISPVTYTVKYVTTGPCPDSSTFNVTITNAPSAVFSYSPVSYCQNGSNPFPIFQLVPPASGGVFSATPAGLDLNAGTGEVNLATSASGTYTVTNFIAAAGGCASASATATIVIDSTTIVTPPSNIVVCNNVTVPTINFSSTVPGTTYTWVSNFDLGMGLNGITNIPTFTAVNTTNLPITATVTISPMGPTPNFCDGLPVDFTITVNPDAFIALDPASGSNTQTVCIGQPINDIIYNISGGGTGAGVSATLPAGVTGSFLGGVFTISGTPTGPAGIYPYTVTTTGSCAQTTATGTITVSPDAILTLTSPIGSDNQTVCINTAITNITYSITGTGNNATVALLPSAGLSYTYVAGILTITGSPSVAGSTTYTVTATGTCGSTTTTFVINVTPLQDPSFTYPSASYCQTGVDPLPAITGSIGGTFSATPAGLVINASTGLIDLSASTINCYTIKYVTAGPCPDSSTFALCVTNPPTAGFSYSPASYCQSGVDPTPVLAAGASAGTFSSTPGLVIDPTTGVIDLSASASGTYTVTNDIAPAGGCAAASATTSVTIDSTTILSAVPNVSVCNGIATAPINFTPTVPGTTYAWSHNGTGIGIATPGTGNIPSFTAINTGTTPIVVTFTVTPTGPTPNFCVGLPITFDITINPDAHIALDPASGSNTQTVCIGQPINDIIYNVTGGGTGAGVIGLPTGVSGSFSGGVFTIAGSPTGSAGIYPYTVTTTGSCAQTTATGTITVSPDATVTLTSPLPTAAQMVCENTAITNITYAIGGTGTGATASGLPAGITGAYLGGVFTISGSSNAPGIYVYTVTATGTCGSSTASGSIEIVPTQLAGFTYSSSTYCQTGTDPLPIFGAGTAAGGTFSATPAGLVINASTGLIDLSASTLASYVVKYVTPGPCPDSATFNIQITLAPCATFTYAAASYCQSGVDPLPTFGANCSAGTFTATPAGLSINPTTGQVDLSLSNAGTYTVTNDILAAGGCAAANASTTITIDSNTVMTDPADQIICNGDPTTLVIPGGAVAGSTFGWTNSNTAIGLAAASGTGNVPSFTGINNTSAPVSTTITYTPTGPTGCPGVQQSFTITVNPDAKLTLTSAAATINQSVCINTPITNIVYTIGGTGNNATVAGLPAGVTAPAPVGNVLTISGTPTVAGTYTYTVTATGTCGSTTSTGTIVVNPNATVTLTSAVGTDAQTVCLFSNITAITYTVGATGTGSTVTGLPPGVTASGSTSISITGAPTAVGSYTYTVTATGTCGSATTTGVINVTPLQDPSFSYPSSTICNTGSACPTPGSIVTPGGVFSVTPALSAAVFNTSTGCFTLPVATTGAYTVKYVTPGPCKDSSTVTINIVTAPCATFSYSAASFCQSAPNPSPIYSAGCSAGNFTALPAGLSINNTSGLINLLLSTAGTYTVTNTIAASGTCPAAIATYTVTVVSKPTFTFVSSTPANCTLPCNGSVINTISGGTGTYTCTISPATAPAAVSNTGTATGLCAGVTYTITATDGIGCTGTTTVSVGTATAPIISIASQTNTTAPFPTCDGTATTLTTSGSGLYAYTISPTATGATINAAGFASALCGDTACITYTIIVTDVNTGCKDTTPVCISAPGQLICSPSHTNVTCYGGNNGTLADTAIGGTTPYTFVSLTLGVTPIPYTLFSSNVITASGLIAGTYVATWKDSNNITCTSNITITQPSIYSFTLPTIGKPSCSPGCDGTLSISATGGTGALSYSIQTPVGVTCTATQTTPGNFSGLGVGVYTVIVSDVNACTGTTTVTISASTPPTITISHNNPSCNNVCDGTATAVGLGGTGTLTYSIQSPTGATCIPTQSAPTSGSFTTLGGGTYTVTVIDTKGCTASDTVTLVNPPAILIDTLTHSNVVCNGNCDGTIHVVASGGTGPLSYTLNPGAITNTTGDFISLCAGTYTISAHDANCNKTSTVVISQPSALAWVTTTSTNITCAGSANGIINTVANGGTNPIQYSKDGVTFGGSGNFTALLAGSYTITAKDAHGCTITTSFTIVEPPVLTLGLPSVQQISCNGASDGSITIVAGGGTPGYVYNIIPAAAGSNTTGIFTGLPPGTYTITVTDTVGCSKPSAGITVSQPAPLLFTLVNHQDVACFGGNTGSITVNTSGGTPGVTYTINPVVGVQSPPGYFSGLTAGIYNVIATDAHNCSVSSIVNVTEGPEIIIVNFTMTEPVCNGDANGSISFTVIGGTGQLKYQLNGGPLQTDTVFNNLIAGNYLLTIIDALGCTKDQVISVKEPEPVGAIIDLHETNCTDSKDGKAIIIGTGGRGGYKYYVTPGLHINKSGIFTGLEAGSYLLRVVDTSGCEYRTNFVINPPANPLSNTITKQDLACNGAGNEGTATANVAGGTPPYTYLWSTTPPQVTPQASTLFYGYYDVTVMDANGCTLKDTIYIEEGPCCDVAFIPNAFSPNGDQLNDEFKILTTAGVELIKLEIYDRWGKRVWSTIDFHKGWDGMIEGRDAANDTYYFVFRYKCTRDNLTYTKKGDLILIR